jgi:hypothetical protein
MTKKEIKALIAQGRIKESIDLLNKATENDDHLHNQVIQVSGRYASHEQKKRLGIESSSNLTIESNQIAQALLNLTDQLPPNVDVTVPRNSINYGEEQTNPPSSPVVQPTPEPAPSPSPSTDLTKTALLLGVLLLLLGTAAALFLCTDGMGYFAVTILLALGAACLAPLFSGSLNIKAFKDQVTAGGAFGLVVLILTLTPAKEFIQSSSNCQQQTDFDLTIQLAPDRSLDIPGRYPPLKDATLKIYPKDEVKAVAVPNNRSVTFKNLTVEHNSEARIELEANYWKLKVETTRLQADESVFLSIVPDGSLGTVSGSVEDSNSQPIANAEIDLGKPNLIANTDEKGYFSIEIPLADQNLRYAMTVRKENYEVWRNEIDPTQENIPVVLTENKNQ